MTDTAIAEVDAPVATQVTENTAASSDKKGSAEEAKAKHDISTPEGALETVKDITGRDDWTLSEDGEKCELKFDSPEQAQKFYDAIASSFASDTKEPVTHFKLDLERGVLTISTSTLDPQVRNVGALKAQYDRECARRPEARVRAAMHSIFEDPDRSIRIQQEREQRAARQQYRFKSSTAEEYLSAKSSAYAPEISEMLENLERLRHESFYERGAPYSFSHRTYSNTDYDRVKFQYKNNSTSYNKNDKQSHNKGSYEYSSPFGKNYSTNHKENYVSSGPETKRIETTDGGFHGSVTYRYGYTRDANGNVTKHFIPTDQTKEQFAKILADIDAKRADGDQKESRKPRETVYEKDDITITQEARADTQEKDDSQTPAEAKAKDLARNTDALGAEEITFEPVVENNDQQQTHAQAEPAAIEIIKPAAKEEPDIYAQARAAMADYAEDITCTPVEAEPPPESLNQATGDMNVALASAAVVLADQPMDVSTGSASPSYDVAPEPVMLALPAAGQSTVNSVTR